MQNTVGVQVRNDHVPEVALDQLPCGCGCDCQQSSPLVTSSGEYPERMEWTPWLKTVVGIRGDASRYVSMLSIRSTAAPRRQEW